TSADRLPVRTRSDGCAGVNQPGGPSANGASAAGADGGRGGGKNVRSAAREHSLSLTRDVGGDGQRRPVLWRRHFRRLRRHHLYAQLYAGVRWDPDRTAAYCPVGDPDGDLRLRDPFGASVATRSSSAARAG